MNNFGKIAILCAAFLIFVGCPGKKESANKRQEAAKVLAKVNGVAITEDDLRISVRTGHGMAPETEKVRAIDDVINAELFYQDALRLGLDKEPSYTRAVERYEKQLANMKRAELTKRIYNLQIAAKVDVTRQEAEDYYKKNLSLISTDLHLGVLIFPSREEAEAVLARIKGGKSFKEVAASSAPAGMPRGAKPQWDMGFVSWGQVPVDYADALYKLKPGETTSVLPSGQGSFRIFSLLENPRKTQADFTAISGLIMTRLRDKKVKDGYDSYVAKLRRNAKIEQFN